MCAQLEVGECDANDGQRPGQKAPGTVMHTTWLVTLASVASRRGGADATHEANVMSALRGRTNNSSCGMQGRNCILRCLLVSCGGLDGTNA